MAEDAELEQPLRKRTYDETRPSNMVPDGAMGLETDRKSGFVAADTEKDGLRPLAERKLKRLRRVLPNATDAERSRAQDALAEGAKGPAMDRQSQLTAADVADNDRKRQLGAADAEKRINEASRRGIGGSAPGSLTDVMKRRKKDSVALAVAAAKAEEEKAAKRAASAAEAAVSSKRAAEEEAAQMRAQDEGRERAELERKRKAEDLEGTETAAASSSAGAAAAASSSAGAEQTVYFSGESPPAEGARPAWALRCFRSFASRQAPDIADVSLLSLPVEGFCERLIGLSQEEFVQDAWLCGNGVTRGIRNLGGRSCFVNAFMQVLVRLEPFVRLLRTHRHQSDSCVLCKIRDQIEDMRRVQVIERSSVTLAARAGQFRFGQDFLGDAATGVGGQCDVWEFCVAVVEEIERWEKDRKRSCFREEDGTTRAQVESRPILQEYVWGAMVRTRNRCANCEGTSDTLMHRQFLELNLVDGTVTLQGLYERWASEFRGADTVCPLRCGGLAYTQYFLEREPPVLFFRLLRFRPTADYRSEIRINRDIAIPEKLMILRSGAYQFAAAVMHHGGSTRSGHYTTLCWEGSRDGEERYRWYSDAEVSTAMTWAEVRRGRFYDGSSIGRGAYILCYVRVGFWGDAVGDGSECAPYVRDMHTVGVAKSLFRGRLVA